LRGSIPVALTVYHMSIGSAFLWSVVGNMIPVYFILMLFEKVSAWLRVRSKKIDRLLTWLFERTQKKLEKDVAKYGWLALAIFVAIPFPATGAWSGALAAFVFGFPKKKAFFAILTGVIIAATIVTILTVGATATVKAFH
ncbi:MAG: small multi-drug export protein, partial [Candidatus Andersenbacteria bacterium]|nr:small multi-drug export protein [Candidatus Andersenbacteria bacterium]